MRVIHLLNHVRFGHGNVHACVDLACAQTAAGDDVIIASGLGEMMPLLETHGIRHVLIDQEHRRPREALAHLWQLIRLIRAEKPDVLHAHMMAGAVIGAIASRLTRTPLITTVHNSFDRHSVLMGLGHRLIAVSAAVKRHMVARRIPAKRICVVLNGTLNAPRRDLFAPQQFEFHHPNIATLCGLHHRKGVQDLIAAFAIVGQQIPDVQLYIGGDGPDRAEYESQAAALPMADRIHFLGEVRDTKAMLGATDIFVLASHADPCALVLPEAREAGCAVVATNVDGSPEVLENGAGGVLVPVEDPPALAEALIEILTVPGRLDELRAAALRGIEKFDIARVARETRDVYAQVARF